LVPITVNYYSDRKKGFLSVNWNYKNASNGIFEKNTGIEGLKKCTELNTLILSGNPIAFKNI